MALILLQGWTVTGHPALHSTKEKWCIAKTKGKKIKSGADSLILRKADAFHCELKSQFDIRLSSLVSLQHIHALLNRSDPGRDYFVPNSNTVYEGSRAGL